MLLKNAATYPTSLRQRVMKAGALSMAGYSLGQAIRFGNNLLITRLLMPDMFGVMGVASVIMVGLALFSDLGLRANVVQNKRGNDPAFLNTAWIVQILRGGLLWLIGLIVAIGLTVAAHTGFLPKGSAYADPRLPAVIAILSFTAVIAGLNSTKLFEASRNLMLGRVVMIDLASQVGSLICILTWILISRSIWALVAGNISGALVTLVLSHIWLSGTKNRWHWDESAFREIFHFGKWIFLSGILGFLAINSDRLMLGGMVGTAVLGVYMIAFNIFNALEQVLSRVTSSVTFPALSEIARERPGDLKEKYYRIHAIVAAAAYFCSGALMMSGEALIGLLYDRRYVDAGWMLEILAIGLLTVPIQVSMQCFAAIGMPQIQTRIHFVRLVSLVVATPFGFHFFGLPGALWGLLSSSFFCLPPIIFYSIRHKIFDVRRELLALSAIGLGIAAGKVVSLLLGH